MDKWIQELVGDVISRARAVFHFTADEDGPRFAAHLEIDKGEEYELPALDAPEKKKRALKSATNKAARRRS
jgi:hypothetical protein